MSNQNESKQDKTHKYQREDIKDYLIELEKHRFYSLQRIDILLIGLSTSGIILIATFIDSLNQAGRNSEIAGFKISIVLFICAILSNFVSQWIAYKANLKYICIFKEKYRDIRYQKKVIEENYQKAELRAKKVSEQVDIANVCSIIFLVLAILASSIFFLIVV